MANYQKIAIRISIIVTIIAILGLLSYLLTKNSKEKYTECTGKVNSKENHTVYTGKVNSKENYTVYTGKVNNELTNYIIKNSQGVQFFTNYHGTNSNINDGKNQPGPSFWNPDNAFIGNDGELHLRYIQNAAQDSNAWASAEAQLLSPLNYGDYFYTAQFVSDGGAGAYSENNDWNTTFGAYTFAEAGLTTPGMCGNYCYESVDNPNACHELDMIEWGKSRDPKNVGIAQWGTQPWFDSNCNFNTKNLDRSAWNFKQADWDAIGAANNNITFRMNWTPTNLEFWAAPGDYGTQPWNKGFQDNVKWHFKYSGDPKNIPTVDGKTYLMFNLWAPGVLIGNNQKIGPSDGKPKEVIIKNIAVPPGGVQPSPSPSSDEVCQIIGKFCDLNGTLGQNLSKGFGMLCQEENLYCWNCGSLTFPSSLSAFPKACIQGNTCNMNNLCDYVGDMWYYLGELRKNISLTFAVYYNSKSAGFTNIQTVNVVVPDALQIGGSGCNSGNVLEFAQQALDTLLAISGEVGLRFDNITYITGCHY